jgi:two-component system, LytTR family, sensor kinase
LAGTSNKGLLLLNVSWWLIVGTVHAYVLSQFSFSLNEILVEVLVTAGLPGVICFLIMNNMRYYLPQREKYWYILFIGIAVSGISTLASKFLFNLFFNDNAQYLAHLQQMAGIRFGIVFLLVSCITMMSLLWYNQEEQKEMNARKTEAEQLAKEAELFKLRQQLQPHFLFNSLNSISALTASQPEKARHMINQLSEFLRGTLKKDEKQWNTLSEELQYLGLYLEIEKVRFGYRLQTDIICDEKAPGLKLPSMLLQPVVENAIKFGLYDTTGEVLIKINAFKRDDNLVVSVKNPFDPETAQPLKGTGFGLLSIQRRLFLLFARQDLLTTATEGDQFITTIIIPQTI